MRKLPLILFILCLPLLVMPAAAQSGPVIQRSTTVRFAVIGDYGDNSPREAEVAALVHSLEPDFVLTTGDNNYPYGRQYNIDTNIGQYYGNFIAPYYGVYGEGAPDENRFFPTLGNHDWATDASKPFRDYFTLPGNERYYEFNWGPAHFFALDSDQHEHDGNTADSIQATWLRERLLATTEPWRIVYMHHPPYSSSKSYSTESAQWPYAAWGASVVLAGHAHTYERLDIDGLPYIINGLGGDDVDSIGEPLAGSQFRFNAAHGAMLVEVTSTNLTTNFYGIYGRPLASVTAPPPVGEWFEADVTATVQANGTYTFVLDGTVAPDIAFSTLESGTNAPGLVLHMAGADEPTTFIATHDAGVNAGTPDDGLGQASIMRVFRNQFEHRRGYIQFEVSGISGTIEQAVVRVHVAAGEADHGGIALYAAESVQSDSSTIWTQEDITWNNAPRLIVDDSPIDTFTMQR